MTSEILRFLVSLQYWFFNLTFAWENRIFIYIFVHIDLFLKTTDNWLFCQCYLQCSWYFYQNSFPVGLPQNLPPRYPETQTQSHSRYLRRRPSVSSCVWCCEWSSRHILQYSGLRANIHQELGQSSGHFVVCADPPSPWQKSDETHWSGQPEFKQDSYLQAVFVLKKPQESLFPKNQCSFIFLWRRRFSEISPDFYWQKQMLCEKRSNCYHDFGQMGKPNPAFMAFSIGLGDSGLKKGRGVAASTYQGRGGGSWGYKSQMLPLYGSFLKWWYPQIPPF